MEDKQGIKPIPEAVYPCKYCSDEYSWPAGDLFWSGLDNDWVCDNCWSDRGSLWDGEEQHDEKRGVSLAEEIKRQGVSPDIEEQSRAIDRFLSFVDGLQGRDLGSADILSWSDIESLSDIRGFLKSYKAHLYSQETD